MYPYDESELSWSEYEKIHKDGNSIEQTVWEIGKLNEDGKIEFQGDSRHQVTGIDKSEYDMKEFAVIVEKGMKSKASEDDYLDAPPGGNLEGGEDEDEEKEKMELWKIMLKWTA
jgi:hypothetical protein